MRFAPSLSFSRPLAYRAARVFHNVTRIKLFELTNRVAIITGGSKGLGEAMGAGLASAGANLMLVSRNAEEAQAAADKIAAEYGCKAIGFAADVSKQADMEAMVAKCGGMAGSISL